MSVLLVDSSVYIAALKTGDSFHKHSLEFFRSLEKEEVEIIIPTLVVLEVINVLQKFLPKLKEEELFAVFSEGTLVDLTLDLLKETVPLIEKVDLKAADAFIAAVARIYNAHLISWDEKLIRESKRLVRAFSPQEYIERKG